MWPDDQCCLGCGPDRGCPFRTNSSKALPISPKISPLIPSQSSSKRLLPPSSPKAFIVPAPQPPPLPVPAARPPPLVSNAVVAEPPPTTMLRPPLTTVSAPAPAEEADLAHLGHRTSELTVAGKESSSKLADAAGSIRAQHAGSVQGISPVQLWAQGSEVALVVPEGAAALLLLWGWRGVGIGIACVLMLIIACTLCCAKMASGRRDSHAHAGRGGCRKCNGGKAYSKARAVSQEPGGGSCCRRDAQKGGQDSDDEGSVFLAKEGSDGES
jgi:hypothetical protein